MATSPDAGQAASGVFPPFDASSFPSQIFWLALTFGVLYLFMSRMILPRIGGTIEKRSGTISQDLEEASRLSERASTAQETLEKELAEARAKARATAAQAKSDIEAEIAAETAKVEAEVETRLTKAASRIADVRNAAMKNVEEVAASTASAIVDKLAGLDVSDEDASSAVTGALKEN